MLVARCIRRPFDYLSFCGKDTRSHVVSHDLNSALLNLAKRENRAICLTCVDEIMQVIMLYKNDKIKGNDD